MRDLAGSICSSAKLPRAQHRLARRRPDTTAQCRATGLHLSIRPLEAGREIAVGVVGAGETLA